MKITRAIGLVLILAALTVAPAADGAARASSRKRPVHRVAAKPAPPKPKPVPVGPAQLSSMRSWTSPAGTRVVFDFNQAVAPVAADTGSTAELVIAVPAAGLEAGPDLVAPLIVRDSIVDSVTVAFDGTGARISLRFPQWTAFRTFVLPPSEDKPFRFVVDASRPGAAAEEARRLASIASAKKKDRVRLVVVDPGHGGEDAGARGPGYVLEKNVTLAVGKQLVEQLNLIPGIRAILTRDRDFFIPLRERYRIAELAKADLFISIHCNSSKRRGSGSGTEVFFLSIKGATDQADADLADMENAADLVGGVPSQAQDDIVNVLYDVKRNAALQRSQLLAETLLDHVAAERQVESRGIKQAGFAVLKSVEFPSVLVETAFINNPREVKLLKDPVFQHALGQQLANGVKSYFLKTGIVLSAPEAPSGGANGPTSGIH